MENTHAMQTRSKSQGTGTGTTNSLIKPEYEVVIDFDEASRAWRENKKQVSAGGFVYLCRYMFHGIKKCKNRCMEGLDFCYIHRYKGYQNSDSSSSDSD